jgi:hypothetical protein
MPGWCNNHEVVFFFPKKSSFNLYYFIPTKFTSYIKLPANFIMGKLPVSLMYFIVHAQLNESMMTGINIKTVIIKSVAMYSNKANSTRDKKDSHPKFANDKLTFCH